MLFGEVRGHTRNHAYNKLCLLEGGLTAFGYMSSILRGEAPYLRDRFVEWLGNDISISLQYRFNISPRVAFSSPQATRATHSSAAMEC